MTEALLYPLTGRTSVLRQNGMMTIVLRAVFDPLIQGLQMSLMNLCRNSRHSNLLENIVDGKQARSSPDVHEKQNLHRDR